MDRKTAAARYIAACKTAGLTVAQMNRETFALMTNDGEIFADGLRVKDWSGDTPEARVDAAEYVARKKTRIADRLISVG